jgi:GTP-binding protein HflX
MFDVKEKPKMVERALLVGVLQGNTTEKEVQNLLDELEELVQNLGISVVRKEIVRNREQKARFLLGTGKVNYVNQLAHAEECDCIVFDEMLSPAQQRNWEAETKLCVIDRHEVILDIFADRAQTREAVLQVELARSEYNLPRLKNAWSHLSRQRGGGTTQRGEGEAQIELDQRMVRNRIAKLKKELKEVVQHRETQRKQRQRVPLPTSAIVGYTNAGKSSLLNKMTGSDVFAADKLFATLDPTTRQIQLPSGQKILLTDTVGFVRKLPHRLVEAFKATLEEAIVSDFLIHVVDLDSENADIHAKTTLEVLKELGAEEKRIITVFNKIDMLPPERQQILLNSQKKGTYYISTYTGAGIDSLVTGIEAILEEEQNMKHMLIPHTRYDIINKLHQSGCVKSEKVTDDGVELACMVPERLEGIVASFIIEK